MKDSSIHSGLRWAQNSAAYAHTHLESNHTVCVFKPQKIRLGLWYSSTAPADGHFYDFPALPFPLQRHQWKHRQCRRLKWARMAHNQHKVRAAVTSGTQRSPFFCFCLIWFEIRVFLRRSRRLEFKIFLLQPPEFWDHRCASPHLNLL